MSKFKLHPLVQLFIDTYLKTIENQKIEVFPMFMHGIKFSDGEDELIIYPELFSDTELRVDSPLGDSYRYIYNKQKNVWFCYHVDNCGETHG